MSNIEASSDPSIASGQAPAILLSQSAVEGFDRWIKDFQKYETVLNEMAKSLKDSKFKEELTTIEKWFKLLNEPERTAALYTLLQHSTQDQIRFLLTFLQQMLRTEAPTAAATTQVPAPVPQDTQAKPRLGKLGRPPSLNLPDLGDPITPTNKESAVDERTHIDAIAEATNWSNLGHTPIVPLYENDQAKDAKPSQPAASSTTSLPGFSGINPYTLNMLANAGLSTEAQLLAAQLVMSGLVQPTGQPSAKLKKPPVSAFRAPGSSRFPSSALRSSGLRPNSSLKSAGLKSCGLNAPNTPFSAMESPREEDFDPEMLKDIPTWLRSLRLHKYTQCFDGLTWQEMVVLDDATLETKGVAALGARRRLLRTFEHVRKRMGMEEPASATPTTATLSTSNGVGGDALHAKSKLSINSPIFTPTWEKAPQSAAAVLSAPATENASNAD
jgi:hypothetical protein